MARRKPSLAIGPLVATVGSTGATDDLAERVLDAGAELLARYGLTRWSMDDVVELAGVGRTSLYRRFSSRDELVYGVLGRELRSVIAAVAEAAASRYSLEDKVVEGAMAALAAVDGSIVERLIRSDPGTVLPFLTTEAGPLLMLARQLLVDEAAALGARIAPEEALQWAELAARLGLSFILTRDTVFPYEDPAAARRTLHRVLGPILAPLVVTHSLESTH